ncbi:hypothetical protein ACRRTK_000423 [Alexandromys fortis]
MRSDELALVLKATFPSSRLLDQQPTAEEDINPSDFGDKLMDLACLEAKYNHSLCHLICHLYCALINSIPQNLEDTLNARNRDPCSGQHSV